VTSPAATPDRAKERRDRPAPSLRGNRAYRRLWSAVAISETGDWLLFIALPLYVLKVSGSALDTSAVFLAELAPAVLVGIVGGPVIDRWNPGRLLTALTSSQAVLLLPLLWLGPDRLWIAYAVAAVQAAITSITTPALQAVVPFVVEPHQLPKANAMTETATNAARLLGSPLGGILLPVLGLDGLVLGDMASFLASATLLAGCRRATPPSVPQPRAQPTSRLPAIGDGPRAFRRNPTLISALIISFLSAVAQGLFLVLFVLFVLRSLHAGDQVVGLLRGVQAIGGVLGGLLVGTWGKHLAARTLTVSGLASFGLLSLLTWNSPAITTETRWYLGLFIAVGLPATALVTGLLTGTQRTSPRRVLGRVLSLIQVAQALGQGTGILLAGLLSGSVSLTVLLNVQASCYLACAVVAVMGFAPKARRTNSDALATAWTTTRARKPDGPTSALAATQPPGRELGNRLGDSAVPLRARDEHCATTGERPA
jgi:predicted MFS family arabinose efflux permease